MTGRLVVVALLAAGCTAPTAATAVDMIESPPAYEHVLVETLKLWDNVVGFRDATIEIRLVRRPPELEGASTIGVCRRGRKLEVYPFEIAHNDFELRLSTAIMHELGHGHMRCSDVDHVDDPRDLMHRTLGVNNLGALPSRAEIDLMWALR